MLDEPTYLFAIYVYTGAAALFVLGLAWWLFRSWSPGWASLAVFLSAALLLTPAFPREGVDTMAPALIVAGFQFFTAGFPAAEHALRPLAYACTGALLLCVLLRVTLFRRRSDS